MNELELRNSPVRFEVKLATGVTCAERDILHSLAGFKDVWQANQYSESMNRDVYLAR